MQIRASISWSCPAATTMPPFERIDSATRSTATKSPSSSIRPPRMRSARVQIRASISWSCPAATTIPPFERIDSATRSTSMRNSWSSASCTSSRSRILGSRCCATAKPTRARIPCEYDETGRSNAAPSRLSARTPSMLAFASASERPPRTPSSCAFSTPVSAARRPALTDRSEPTRPSTRSVPASGSRTPDMSRRSVVFPDPLGPMSARPSPGPAEKLTSRRPQASVTCRRSRATVDVTTRPLPSNWKRTPRPSATMAARFTRPPSRTAPARGGRRGRRARGGRRRRAAGRARRSPAARPRRGTPPGTTRRGP